MEPSTKPDIIIGLDVGKTDHHACALTNTGERIYDNPLPPRRSRTARNLLVHAGPRQRFHGRRSTQHDRRPAHRRGPRLRLHGRRPPRPSHAKSSRSLPWTIKNRPPGCIHHRRHRPHHAAHTAGSRPRRRDTSSAEDARRIPRRHRQRRHPNEKPPSQRAHTDSPRTRARLCR